MEFIIGLISFIFFLFMVFIYAKDDFVFLRRNINLESMFNYCFLAVPVIIFFSRFVFAAESFSIKLFNPLIFFLIPYFPGLSISGGIVGGLIYVWILSLKPNFPWKRVLDVFSISFLVSSIFFSFFYGVYLAIFKNQFGLVMLGQFIYLIFGSLFFVRFFQKGFWKDSTNGFVTLFWVTAGFFVTREIQVFLLQRNFFDIEGILLLILTFILFFLSIRAQIK